MALIILFYFISCFVFINIHYPSTTMAIPKCLNSANRFFKATAAKKMQLPIWRVEPILADPIGTPSSEKLEMSTGSFLTHKADINYCNKRFDFCSECDVGVFCCGTKSLSKEIKVQCVNHTNVLPLAKPRFVFHKEKFWRTISSNFVSWSRCLFYKLLLFSMTNLKLCLPMPNLDFYWSFCWYFHVVSTWTTSLFESRFQE